MEKVLYKSLLFLFPVIFGIAGSSSGSNLSILSSSDKSFHFIITISPDKLDWQVETDSLASYYEAVLVGVPYGAQVRLISSDARSLTTLGMTKNIQTPLSTVSHDVVELSQVTTIRGRQIVTVRVYPIVNPNSYYKEIEIQLSFEGGRSSQGTLPNDPVFDNIFRASLANYEQFRTWLVPERAVSKRAVIDGPFASGKAWYKIRVASTGLYKVSGAQLSAAGLDLTNLPSDSLHLFYGGGKPLPVNNDDPRPTFSEVAIIVNDGGDGIFDAQDYIMFYGEAVNRWVTEQGSAPRYYANRYELENCYWLTISGSGAGLRMSSFDAAPGGVVDTTITTFTRRLHSEQDNLLRRHDGRISDYYTWYWTDQTALIFFINTPGVVPGADARFVLQGRTFAPGYMEMRVNDSLATDTCNQFNCRYGVTWLNNGPNKIELSLTGTSNTKPYFDYLEVEYQSYLEPSNNSLDIIIDPYAGQAQFEVIDNFDYPVLILDITESNRPVIMNNFNRSQGTISFIASLDATTYHRYYLSTPQIAMSPTSIQNVRPGDLYDVSDRADLLVVTTSALAPALDEYVTYRRDRGIDVKVVTVEDIYDNYSFGLFDPTAIRDFLKYAYENYPAPAPSVVLFVGDGNYDYHNILKTGVPNYVPSYLRSNDESASDDNYVYFGSYGILDSDTSYINVGDRGLDMVTARMPIRSAEEIDIIMAKIKQYESPSSFGMWRNDITLVADDEYGTFNTEMFHTTQTEELEKKHIPAHFHRNKIYLWEYPFVNREKPAVNDEIVKAINNGTLLINYVGHGNPDVWAHEHVFTRSGDVPRLNNFDKLALVFTASCAIGFFDDPMREGMAEDLLVHPAGGAIAVVSATRLVYSSENAAFNQKAFDVLFSNDSLTIAEAIYIAKLQRQYRTSVPVPIKNDRAYLLFGDPYIKLGMPKLKIQFSQTPDSLTALARTQITGQVVDAQGQPVVEDGELIITVYDSDRPKTYRLVNDTGGTIQTVDYSVTGPTIFRGTADITGGQFDFSFITPLDIGYGGEGAKISAYAKFAATDGIGLIDSLHISDVVAPSTDSSGPVITYRIQGQEDFVSGDIINNNDVLEIILADSSGINLTGALGHGITLTLDNRAEKAVNLTSMFAYDKNSFVTGRLTYTLTNLEPGQHIFKIKAWDNANNSSVVQFVANIQSEKDLAILDLLNYPNPMKESTRFSLNLTRPVSSLHLDIFTLSGRKIKSFERHPSEAGYFDDIVWYGTDFTGDRIATGVYIYKVTAVPATGGDVVEAFGKVVVVN